MVDIVAMLAGGDRRSIGRAAEVVALLRRDGAWFDAVFACLRHADPVVRMRAADALEKYSRESAAAFAGHRNALLSGALDDGTAEMRWHLIAITARLPLDDADATSFLAHLDRCLRHDPSRIVKVMALQAAFNVTRGRPMLAARFAEMLDFAATAVWPSLRARARKLTNIIG